MTDAKFYILGAAIEQAQMEFVCRLTQQLLGRGKQVHIQLESEHQAQAFDQLLWNFHPESFVPHALVNDKQRPDTCQVDIGWQDHSHHHHDVLINLSATLPNWFSRFDRLVEVVVQSDPVLAYTREHFRLLRDRGYAVDHEDMRVRA